MPYKTFLIALIGLNFACSSKPEVAITQDNVREVLTEYGKQNPETRLVLHTSMGDMQIRLYEDTPLHRANFLRLIKEGYLKDADFYRVVSKFAIQGGDQKGKKDNFLIPSEFNANHFHKKGALAMARFDEGNPQKFSTSTEFYLVQGEKYTEEDLRDAEIEFNIKSTPSQREAYLQEGGLMELDGQYTVFGEVTSGQEVIDKIAAVPVNIEKPIKKIPLSLEILN